MKSRSMGSTVLFIPALLGAMLLGSCRSGGDQRAPQGKAKKLPLLYTDLDETLLSSKGTISACNMAALKRYQKAGGRIGIATGRFPDSAGVLAKQVGSRLPVISANGAVIHSPGGALLRLRGITDPTFFQGFCGEVFRHQCKKYYTAFMNTASGKVIWGGQRCEAPQAGFSVFKMKAQQCENPGEFLKVTRSRFAAQATIINAGSVANYHFAVSAPGVDKGDALLFVAKSLGYPSSRLAFVGNGGNDVSGARAVHKAGGKCFVVANGVSALKAACPTHLAQSNDNCALGRVVEILLRQ
ncbi:Cof-type HAD-IIB family hydrolase [Myxococcota bacterium]|nr:Cof-type HAD-IIB family hydrolase [Myxococcota bacterium]MBU1536655.1 Cof-type HAD-IIB family hydrolase [Myxococcota bacterium]